MSAKPLPIHCLDVEPERPTAEQIDLWLLRTAAAMPLKTRRGDPILVNGEPARQDFNFIVFTRTTSHGSKQDYHFPPTVEGFLLAYEMVTDWTEETTFAGITGRLDGVMHGEACEQRTRAGSWADPAEHCGSPSTWINAEGLFFCGAHGTDLR